MDLYKPTYDEDILLYTMEKVGTTTVMNTVKSAGIPINRATFHNIKDFDHRKKQIITVFRDPIDWAISYYLEMPDAHPDDILEPENFGTVENFAKNVNPMFAIHWPIPYFKKVVDINVYGTRFVKEKGYFILSENRVLVILTHRLGDTLVPALSVLTERPESEFTLHQHQTGMERFGAKYIYLHNNIRYERMWFIENIDKTRYIRQFFNLEERRAMIDKWTI